MFYMHIHILCITSVYYMYYEYGTGLPNPGPEAVGVKGVESDRSSFAVTCNDSSPNCGLTGMKYSTRNKSGTCIG